MPGERLSPGAEQGPRGFSTWWGIVESRRLPVPLSQISMQILLGRPWDSVVLYGSSLFLTVHRLRALHHGRFQICSGLGMRSRLAAWGLGHLQSWAWGWPGVCGGQHHPIIIFPISLHRWFGAIINRMCFLNITKHFQMHPSCVFYSLQTKSQQKLIRSGASQENVPKSLFASKWGKMKTWLLFLQRTPSWSHKFWLFNAQWQL